MQQIHTTKRGFYFVAAALAFLLIGELYIDLVLAPTLPNYNWLTQTLSYLGAVGSPLLGAIKIWGVCFTLLFSLFAYGFYTSFNPKSTTVKIGAVMLFIYGLGEGIGSGFFPIDESHTAVVSTTALLHNVFGGVADFVAFCFPFVVLLLFPRIYYRQFHVKTWAVMAFVILFSGLFIASKYLHSDNLLLTYRGLWQRSFMVSFYVYFIFLSAQLYRCSHD